MPIYMKLPGMTRQEQTMWRSMLGLSAVPGVISIIIVWILLPESPRFLSFVDRHDEGVQVRDR